MNYTPNLNLKKPAKTDPVLIDDLNENADIIDQLVGTLQHQAAILKPEGGKLWHFDTSLESTDGIKPLEGAVATLRPNEGRFGGAVAVEEGTTNLVPSNRLKFEGWIAFEGAQVTLTQNVDFPEIGRNDATRIRTTGGTNALKYFINIEMSIAGQAYTGSVYIKNIGSKPVRFRTQLGPIVTVNPGEWTRAIVSGIGNGASNFQLRFEALNADDDLDFIAWGPQGEYKPFATSFVDGTRAAGKLEYPTSLMTGSWTLSAWLKRNYTELYQGVAGFGSQGDSDFLYWILNYSGMIYWGLKVDGTVFFLSSWGDDPHINDTDNWHHHVVQVDNDALKARYFLDGVLFGEKALPSPVPPITKYQSFGLGGYYTSSGIKSILIDELLILPYAATEEEIKGWYEAKKPFIDQDEINTIDQKLKTHMDAAAPHSGHETPSGAQTKVDTHAAVQASLSQLGHVNHAVLTTTLDTAWQGSTAPYTKTQTVNGLLATDTPIVDVVMSGDFETDEARIEAWGYVYRITTANNAITLYATEKPTVSLPIQLKVVR